MLNWLQNLARGAREHPRRTFLAVAGLLALGFGGYYFGHPHWVDWEFHRHLRAAQAARRAGDLEEANRHLQECARLSEKSPDLPLEQALLKAQRGDLSGQEVIVRANFDADDPDAVALRDALIGHATQQMERLDFRKAHAQLTLALRLAPADTGLHFLMARCLRRGESFVLAERHLAACAKLGGDTPDVYLERALLRAQQGDLKSVEGFLQGLVDQDHPEGVLILEALTRGYMRISQLGLALECIKRWTARQPKAIQAFLWQAAIRERLGEFGLAAEAYRHVLDLDPSHVPTRLRLAELLLDRNERAEAQAHLERLEQQEPNNPKVVLLLARCRRTDNRLGEAAQLLDRLLAQQATDVAVLVERGKLALDQRKPDEAAHFARKAIQLAPSDREAYHTLHRALLGRDPRGAADALEAFNRLDQKEKELGKLKAQVLGKPHDLDLRRQIGALCLETGRGEDGVAWLESILRDDPNRRDIHQLLTDYFAKTGQPKRAAQHRLLAGPKDGAKR